LTEKCWNFSSKAFCLPQHFFLQAQVSCWENFMND
jgi:hypothetical protein